MKPRRLVFLGLGLAALIVAFAIVVNLLPGTAPQNQAQSRTSSSAGTGADGAPATSTSAATSQSTPAASAAAKTTAATTAKAATPKPAGGAPTADPAEPLEVNGPAPQATKLVLPTSQPRVALVFAPLPKSADATGKVAPGYPVKALPPVDGSKIVSSSVSPQNAILQTSMVASTSKEALAVKAFYQDHFAPLGFGMADAPATAGSSAIWFTRGADKITLTITAVKGGATYIVYGVLHAGK